MKKLSSFIFHLSSTKGFTLIELLVVIAVIGILAGGLFSIIDPIAQINKAKDAQRRQDLAQLKIALDAYYNDHNKFPSTLNELKTATNPYIKAIPKDPGTGSDYFYVVDKDNNAQWNALFAKLSKASTTQNSCPASGISINNENCPIYNSDIGCTISGKVDCAYLAANLPPGDGIVPTSVPLTPTLTPTQTPTLTPTPTVTPTPECGTVHGSWSASANTVATDVSGNVYVGGGNFLKKFDSSGTLLATTTNSAISYSLITVDKSNSILYAINNNGIHKLDLNFNLIQSFNYPTSGTIAVSPDGAKIYYLPYSFFNVNKFQIYSSSNFTLISTVGSVGFGDGQFRNPVNIRTDANGNVYVSDSTRNDIQKFDSNGNYIIKFHIPSFGDYDNFTVDANGNLFVTYHGAGSFDPDKIRKYDSNGNYITEFEGGLLSPTDITTGLGGFVYVADWNANKVYKFFCPS